MILSHGHENSINANHAQRVLCTSYKYPPGTGVPRRRLAQKIDPARTGKDKVKDN